MSTDITRDFFYWFKGGSEARGTADEHAQLENNLTKAFISVLEHCDRQAVLKAFLRVIRLPLRTDVAFSLQRRPFVTETVRKRVLVGITGGEVELRELPASARAGRPDAWIFSDKWAVLVESKIGKKLSPGQLRAHARAAGWGPRTYRLVLLTWEEIHKLCKSVERRVAKKDAVSRLLLRHWLAYLEHQNMAEFDKLDESDFDFFGLPPEERRAMLSPVRSRMHSFAELLAKRPAAKQIAGLYKRRKVGAWKYSDPNTYGPSYWFNVGGDGHACRQEIPDRAEHRVESPPRPPPAQAGRKASHGSGQGTEAASPHPRLSVGPGLNGDMKMSGLAARESRVLRFPGRCPALPAWLRPRGRISPRRLP